MKELLVWMDLEMTGLDPQIHVILEIATIITDNQLNIVAEGPDIVIRQSEDALHRMEPWSRNQHQSSGLLDRVKQSPYTAETAEKETLDFVSKFADAGKSPLCGNSIWNDRRFLRKHMPQLDAFFHYRIIDVSSVKELARRWYPSLPGFKKRKTHLALNDARESIEELKYYRKHLFNQAPS